jgi:hypothetical protein
MSAPVLQQARTANTMSAALMDADFRQHDESKAIALPKGGRDWGQIEGAML